MRRLTALVVALVLVGCATTPPPYVGQGPHPQITRGHHVPPVDFLGNVFAVLTKLILVRQIPFGAYFLEDPERSPVVVFPWLWIVHVGNKGAAWGLGAQYGVRPFLVFLALAVLAFRLSLAFRRSLISTSLPVLKRVSCR